MTMCWTSSMVRFLTCAWTARARWMEGGSMVRAVAAPREPAVLRRKSRRWGLFVVIWQLEDVKEGDKGDGSGRPAHGWRGGGGGGAVRCRAIGGFCGRCRLASCRRAQGPGVEA